MRQHDPGPARGGVTQFFEKKRILNVSVEMCVRRGVVGWTLMLLLCSCAGNRAARVDLSLASGVDSQKIVSPANPEKVATLTVRIQGFRSEKGFARAALFKSGDGFPSESGKALLRVEAPVRGGEATLVFREVPTGAYAVSVMHDETGDGTLDVSGLGIPREGFCASNDAVGVLGPPSFEQARFDLNQSDQRIEIKMRYYLPLEP
jgi:uncharacterized protein (DUF2141 family)